ncbi:MAG: carbamate kinase, partial [Hyphomicrobiales bacterium]|nr:carbamate kinase [Hyphomicrobiales bacterium]
TQIEVDPKDPAFKNPTKPIGPFYARQEAQQLRQESGWSFMRDGEQYRRVVPSPQPKRIFEMDVVELLVEHGVVTICAGGGGIPTIVTEEGRLAGVEAVIDKDLASALLARQLKAQAFLLLTDVDGVYANWDQPQARRFRRIQPDELRRLPFAAGSMGPKVEAACNFVEATGGTAGIGALKDASNVLAGNAGTLIAKTAAKTEYWN